MMVRRFPLIAFFVLAYALTWWVYPLLRFSPLIGLLGLFGPALAAIVVTASLTVAAGSRPCSSGRSAGGCPCPGTSSRSACPPR